jgi:unsaturated rhamnogalacturonyl hydrolase
MSMRPTLIFAALALVWTGCVHTPVTPRSEVPKSAAVPKSAEVLATMERVGDWQLAHPPAMKSTDDLSNASRPVQYSPRGWVQAAGYTGIMALGELSTSPRFFDAMRQMGEKNEWKPGPRPYHADDQCVIQTYAELYFRDHNPAMLAPSIARLDNIIKNPADISLEFVGPRKNDRWAWCDSLYMAPPAWIRMWKATGNAAYLDYAVKNWWLTSDFLYNKDEHLYFRDSTFFTKREENGMKVFWSRGNGWVIGGLVRMLEYLPADHPDRPRFEQQFKDMMARLITLQQPDNFWHASLLDPAHYPEPEESGTGFFCYGLAWGINHGLLDREKFLPATLRAWSALTSCVDADGKLKHVQPIGSDPKKFDPNSTEPYGVGSFLLAGSEIYRLGGK